MLTVMSVKRVVLTSLLFLSAGQHVGISLRSFNALYTNLQTVDPGSDW